ncbi:hypothetical protein ACFYO2_21335 [Streptomyces sp. NPDC006602]|uniref:hypothetical protein n=1 Tax=Streptomyces sp. NPDC006602 TaxID=3364751 RepID=UPI003699C050
MDQLLWILFKVAFFGFLAGLAALVISLPMRDRRNRKRIKRELEQLPQFAAERGWTYEPFTEGRIDQFAGAGPIIYKGADQPAWNYTTGRFRGRSFMYFDYRYKKSRVNGDTDDVDEPRPLVVQAVFIITTPGSGAHMEIRRRTRLDALLNKKLTIPVGVPEFDEEFLIFTKDEAFPRTALSGNVIPFLLTDPRAKKSRLLFHENGLGTWYTGTLSRQAVDDNLNYLCDVLDLIPERAWTAA